MIERQTIDGREATIAYFDGAFQPIDDLSKPHFAKVLFDDGEMLILHSPGEEEPDESETVPATSAPKASSVPGVHLVDTDEHSAEAWAKHRQRQRPRRIKIKGQTLATWARSLLRNEMQVVEMAVRSGITHGMSNTDIAHLVIGSRKLNGKNGATEITRQHILRLAKGYLRSKSRMSGSDSE